MKPAVSVLIPAYNAEETLESAIGSMLRQTLYDIEIVVVNDGSTDSTPEILDSLARQDSRIRVINSPQRGIIHALNIGIAACEGEYIARMDADDISHPRRLEMQASFMRKRTDVNVCATLIKMFPRAILPGGMVRYEQWMNSLVTAGQLSLDVFVESPVAHPSVMLRKDELIKIGGYRDMGWAEDYDLWLRYHTAGMKIEKIPSALVFWRQTSGRLTFTDPRYSLENFIRAKAHFLSMKLKDSNRPIILWGAGNIGRRLLKHLLRNGTDVEIIVAVEDEKIGHTLRDRPIVGREYIHGHRDAFVIASVGSAKARKLIRKYLDSLELLEGRDYICAA